MSSKQKRFIVPDHTKSKLVYHTGKDCQYIERADKVVEASEECLNHHNAELCKKCAGEIKRTGGDKSYIQALREAGE